MIYYARRAEENGETIYQLLSKHSANTANMCERFVGQYFDGSIGYAMGCLHDIGKYTHSFQRRIRGEKIVAPHAKAGAMECEKLYGKKTAGNLLYRLIGMAVCGHHGGLADWNTYKGKVSETEGVEFYGDWQSETPSPPDLEMKRCGLRQRFPRATEDKAQANLDAIRMFGFQMQFWGRFLFSALVDADRLDAQNFPNGEADRLMGGCESLSRLKEKLDAHLAELKAQAAATPINAMRQAVLDDCIKAAVREKGFFSLSVPTGGGKTLSSMAFALAHAQEKGLRRVVYAIPFMSIIEQNARVFADIFGRRNVLEHHSNFTLLDEDHETGDEYGERYLKLKLARENWHEPIIVTTNVQFFETLFTRRAGKARKLHNIAGSVIVLDEAQSVPVRLIRPCMEALHELTENYGCSVVLCTATQPEYDRNRMFLGEVRVREIVGDAPELFARLRRVEPLYLGARTTEDIAARLKEESRALAIVNTKKHARELFRLVSDSGKAYHLSTNMYPAHRKAVFEEIRRRLKDGLDCVVVSTQLIEAGVDIDFPAVYRAAAGVDSMAQAAGRCNREGKLKAGRMYVFDPGEAYSGKGNLALTGKIGGRIAAGRPDFLDLEAVRAYFRELFDVKRDALDNGILDLCAEAAEHLPELCVDYEKIDEKFNMIDGEEFSLVIQADQKVSRLLEEARYAKSLGSILRELSQYTVGLRRHELLKLCELRAARPLDAGIYVLTNPALYHKAYGLVLEGADDGNYVL